MSRKKLHAKKILPETLLGNRNVENYLAQYRLSTIFNPSDDSDFEDTSYETDLQYEIEKNRKKQLEEAKLLQTEEIREYNSKLYFDKHKNNPRSIFNLQGIHFDHYSHNFVSFIFTPSAFNKKYVCAHRKYHVSLKFRKSWWVLRRFHVPNKDEILRIFEKHLVVDENLILILLKIYEALVQRTHDQINTRKEKYKKFLSKEEVELNSDDEKLFFTNKERIKRKDEVMKIWKRMLPPTT